MNQEALTERVLAVIRTFDKGISDDELTQRLADDGITVDANTRMAIIVKLQRQELVQIMTNQFNRPVYLPCDEAEVEKLNQCESLEREVYKVVKDAARKGIWLRDIKDKLGSLSQTQLTKFLKSLEQKRLVKQISSVTAGKRKVFMLYDLEPDLSVTGGVFYNDGTFDTEFARELEKICFRFAQEKALNTQREAAASGRAAVNVRIERDDCQLAVNTANTSTSASDGTSKARKTDLLQVEMRPTEATLRSAFTTEETLAYIERLRCFNVVLQSGDVEQVLRALVFDGKLEELRPVASSRLEPRKYRVARDYLLAGMAHAPCSVCPLFRDCRPGGASVAPATCKYLDDWLVSCTEQRAGTNQSSEIPP